MNNRGIGVELVNPYAPKFWRKMDGRKTIPAEWWTWCPDKNDRRYVCPTEDQLIKLVRLVDYLCEKYDVPFIFPTAKIRKKQIAENVPAGIVAHRDFGKHSDGRYPLEFLIKNSLMRDTGVKSAIY
jgi:hypothetical protein